MYRRLICSGTLGAAIMLSACNPSIQTVDAVASSSNDASTPVVEQTVSEPIAPPVETVAEIKPAKKTIVDDTKWLKRYEKNGYKIIFSSTDRRVGMLLNVNDPYPRFIVKMAGNTMQLDDCSEDLVNPRPTVVGGYKVQYSSSYVCPSNMMEIDMGYRDDKDTAVIQVKDVMSQEKLVTFQKLEGR